MSRRECSIPAFLSHHMPPACVPYHLPVYHSSDQFLVLSATLFAFPSIRLSHLYCVFVSLLSPLCRLFLLLSDSAVTAYLHSLSPAATDAALRSLGLDFALEEEELAMFLDYLRVALDTPANFELTQAHLNLFLKVGGSQRDRCLSGPISRLHKYSSFIFAFRHRRFLPCTVELLSFVSSIRSYPVLHRDNSLRR